MKAYWITSILLPFLALALQWALWPWLQPFVWLLFFPTIFFSARLGGLWAGLISTLLSAAIVWFFFIPPQLSWQISNPSNLYSVGVFLVMGYLFSDTQERLRRAQRKTEVALAETRAANEQITQLYKKTLELDELKSQFFANVSHELRTPLTLMMSPLSRRLSMADLPEAQRREDEMILRNARLLYRHVSDILDAAKLESGHMAVDYVRLDLARLTRTLASHFDSMAKEKRIDYLIKTPKVLEVEVDGEKLQRILLNLLSNAFKFTPEGGRIEVRLSQEADWAIIEAQDNGPGVPADLRGAVFERFRQLDGGAQRRFGGTGLGLAIVKEFTELHRGKVDLTEAPGGGALFVTKFPLSAPIGTTIQASPSQLDPVLDHPILEGLWPPADAVERLTTIQARANAPLVLVVEDNVDMNAYLAEVLSPTYRVACAFDGREGLERALMLQPDLILSDVMMPRMSGDLMVQELRRQPALMEVPIVMLTANVDEELRVSLLKIGVQDYLNKPFSITELLARVAGLIKERKRTQIEVQRYEQIVATSGDMLAFVDRQQRFLLVNPAYARRFGLEPKQLQQQRVADVVGADTYKLIAPYLEQALAGIVQRFSIEPQFADGKCRVMDAEYRPFWQDGVVQGVVASLRDITELKQAEAKIRSLNAELEQRVIERTAELTAANRELDSFAYAVSHDLRAPLRAMSGFSQALVEDYGGQLQGDAKVYLDQIVLASRKMGELIDGLLVLSRSTRGELRHENVDISELSRRLLAELARAEPDRQIVTAVDAGLNAKGDGRMIEAVMRNLLGNAWKYSANAQAARIRVYTEMRDGARYFCVADNGAGFEMAHANRLFQPFQRLHRQDEFPGLGIGLATVQRIVHRHGGTIEGRGKPGEGAVFCFTLPSLSTAIGERS